MVRDCAQCGGRFEPKRTAKFCSQRCAQRHRRGGLKSQPAEVVKIAASGSKDGRLERQTRKELDDAKRVDTMLGQLALAIARQIDAGRDSGSVVTSLARELRSTMAAATLGASKPKDPVDELAKKRQHRLADLG